MQKRFIGGSELEVPVICLGTMTWGVQNTEAQAHEQLSYAVDQRGINFIDTAEAYPVPPDIKVQGRTETYIGNWLKKRGKRDDVILATKIGAGAYIGTRNPGKIPHYDRKSIREAVEGSLQRLQTSYIDLYQIHFPERNTNFFGVRGYSHHFKDDSTPIAETLDALAELVKEGKVRHIGVSNETPWGLMQYLNAANAKGLPKIISTQNQYSLTNRTYEVGLAEMTIKEQIGLLAYSPIGMGVLSGKYLDDAKPEGARFTLYERNRDRYNPARAQEAVKRYVKLAHDYNLDPAQMALAFVISRDFVTSAIIGATNLDQLKSNIDAADIVLPADLLAKIEEVYNDFPDVTC